MKEMVTKTGVTLVLLFAVLILGAQEKYEDKLVKRDGKVIICKVREIGDDEIKYNEETSGSGVLIGIDKVKIEKIILADGKEIKISDPLENREEYSQQRKNAVKFNLFLPVSGATAFSYERSIKPGMSLEGELGIISSGHSSDISMQAKGQFVKIGLKLIRSPDFYLKGMKYSHILKGSYIKPELAVAAFSYDKTDVSAQLSDNTGQDKGDVAKLAVLINIGKQVVFNNLFVVDTYIGAGYSLGKKELQRYFAFTGGSQTSFAMTAGVRVGFLFGQTSVSQKKGN